MAPRIPIDSVALFQTSVETLSDFHAKSQRLLANNFAVAIAALIHRDSIRRAETAPPVKIHYPGSGEPITTHAFQTEICDPIYARNVSFLRKGSEGPIYKPFSLSFKGTSPGTNNWRNSFDLQGGLGCDAPYSRDFLLDTTYLDQGRFDCQFRNKQDGTCESPAGLSGHHRTCFNPNKRTPVPGPETKAQHRPKLFNRGRGADGRAGFWIVEPTESMLADLVGEPTKRVPIYPFLCALYAGSNYLAPPANPVGPDRLQDDLQLDDPKFYTLFEFSEDNQYNKRILDLVSGNTSTPTGRNVSIVGSPSSTYRGSTNVDALSSPQARQPRDPLVLRRAASTIADPERRATLLERATRSHERTVQAVADQLILAGLSPQEQLDGFDLYAEDDTRGYLFEIKSWTSTNFRRQVRMAVAQLLEYRWRNREIFATEVLLYLVLDRKPPEKSDSWIWEFLANEQSIAPCWIQDKTLRTFPDYDSYLQPFGVS